MSTGALTSVEASRPPRESVDVVAAVEGNERRGWLLLAAGLLAGVLVLDGFDLVILGFVAPAVSEHFGLSQSQMGLALTLQQAALAAGGVLGGWLGDRWGRRVLICASVGTFAAGSILTAIAPSAMVFTLARVVSGVGLGSVSPNIGAYLMEVLPARSRGGLTTLAYAALGVGSTLCALVAKLLLSVIGWQGLFVIGGVLPLLLLPALFFLLPESPAFLLSKGRSGSEIAAALNAMCGRATFRADQLFQQPPRRSAHRARFSQLMGQGLLRDTLALWLVLLTLQFTSVAIVNMGATLVTAVGIELHRAIDVMFAYSLAALAGSLLAAWGIRYWGSRIVLAAYAAVACLSLGIAAAAAQSGVIHFQLLRVLIGATGFAVMGIALASFSLAANLYPTAIRSTGTGLAVTVGRLGSIIGPSVLGLTLAGKGPGYSFGVLSLACGVALAGLLILGRHLPRSSAR